MSVSVELCLREGRSVNLNRLADAALLAVELHGALDFERGRVGGVIRDANEDHPLLDSRDAVVDDSCAG